VGDPLLVGGLPPKSGPDLRCFNTVGFATTICEFICIFNHMVTKLQTFVLTNLFHAGKKYKPSVLQ